MKTEGAVVQFLKEHHACDVLTLRPGDILTNGNVMYINAALRLSEYGVFKNIKQRIPDIKIGGLRAVLKRLAVFRKTMSKRPEAMRDYAAQHFATVPAAKNLSAADSPAPLAPSSSDDDSTAMTTPVASSSTAPIHMDVSPLSPVRTDDSTPSATGSLLTTPVTPHGRTAEMRIPNVALFRTHRTSPLKTRRHCLRCADTRKELREAKEKHANSRRQWRREIKDIHRRYSTPKRTTQIIKRKESQVANLKESVKPQNVEWQNERRRRKYALDQLKVDIDKLNATIASQADHIQQLKQDVQFLEDQVQRRVVA